MTETMTRGSRIRVPVGCFAPQGGTVEYLDIEGEPVARVDEEGGEPAVHNGPPTTTVRQALYRTPGPLPYLVHSLVEFQRPRSPVVGRVERFASLAQLMVRYPELARSAGYRLELTPSLPRTAPSHAAPS